jgi:nucleoside-diphosphate-sugar epimerase
MRVLVTGGSGYLGVQVRQFFNADDFSRRSGLDINNPLDATKVADYDVVIHLAAHLDKSPAAAELCFQTNAQGTANLLKHMRSNAVFIYASTKDVYGAHANAYNAVPESCSTTYCGQTALEWSKLMGEQYAEYYGHQRGLRTCVFRMSTIYARPSKDNEYGFVTHYVESVKHHLPIKVPLGGHPVRDILHADDFCRACRAFVDSSRSTGLYNLGGGQQNAATLREIIETIGRLIDLHPIIENDDTMPHPVPVNYVTDLNRIEKELGWSPQISIEEGLRTLL